MALATRMQNVRVFHGILGMTPICVPRRSIVELIITGVHIDLSSRLPSTGLDSLRDSPRHLVPVSSFRLALLRLQRQGSRFRFVPHSDHPAVNLWIGIFPATHYMTSLHVWYSGQVDVDKPLGLTCESI